MSDYRKKAGKPVYNIGQDSVRLTTPHVQLKVSCPGGLDLELAQQLINVASGLEFMITENVAEGKVFTNSGFRVDRDSSLPDGVMEFRDNHGEVLRRLIVTGKKPVLDDEED